MRFSNVFSRTLREQQREADTKSYNFLLRAGYIRPLASGIFSYLHFGLRSIRKIEQILREEMDNIGGDEICMPVVHPAEIWKKTNRWYDIDESLLRFKDRSERDMVLAMTHEEVVAELTKNEITSYKQLPKLVYQIQTKYRDEARARGGLIRGREFTMKDAYSLDTSVEGLEKQYDANYKAYLKIFKRTGLPVIAIQSDTGMMGGKIAHEFMYITPAGEDTIFICEESGYKANKEVARIRKIPPAYEKPKALKKIFTPNAKTIEELSVLLNVDKTKFAKVVFFSGIISDETKVILAIVRGDMDVNPIKVQNKLKAKDLKPATDDEIKSIKSVPGFASPIGIDKNKSVVIVDELIAETNNLVIGANENDYHYENSCHGRDYTANFTADIVEAFDGALCPVSESQLNKLKSVRGIEIGNIFQLGTKYTEALNAMYTDEKGKRHPIIMGSYGIGVGRLLACLAEEYSDDNGLKLPISVAPYQVILVALIDNEEINDKAEELYSNLKKAGIEVVYDDRDKKTASNGEKFNDADLIGIPLRLTISKRSLKNGGIEMKLRNSGKTSIIPLETVIDSVKSEIANQFLNMRNT